MKAALRILLVAVLLYSYWTYVHLAMTRPSLADYERATAYIRARFQTGDLIDVAPFWAGRVREYLGDLPLASFRHLEAEDLTRYRRVWLFSLFGAEGSAHQALAARTHLLEEQRFERIDVRLYQVLGHELVRYDFRDGIAGARVWIVAGGEGERCEVWDGHRWWLSRAASVCAGREILEIGEEPRAVVSVHPRREQAVRLEFAEVSLGLILDIAAGVPLATLGHGGAPVVLTVEVDGREVMRTSYPSRAGFFRQRVDTSGFAPGTHRVTFTADTDDEGPRPLGFAAEVRD